MSENQSILIVEDNRELLELLEKRLGNTYKLSFATDGEAGFATFMEVLPDMVLLDLSLPKMDGFEVLKAIKATDAGKEVPVIILTAMSDTTIVVKSFSHGADDYVVKPFNFMELSARIKSHLTIRSLQKQLIGMERLKMLREVAVSFNHEVNNPLTSILIFAHVLKNKLAGSDKEIQEIIDGITSETKRISEIVRKLSEATNTASVSYMPGVSMIDFEKLTDKTEE